MTAANAANGRAPARKQLSDQLDRLDSIIDALAEGLNQAVADACREGARAAVREVLMELISNPDLIAAVRATALVPPTTPDEPLSPPTKPPATAPSFWSRVKATAKRASQAVTGAARALVKTVASAVTPATDALKLTGTTRTVVAVALGVGLTAGVVSLICPTWLGALLAAATGVGAVAAQVGSAMNSLLCRLRSV
jgi:hypothetical protein